MPSNNIFWERYMENTCTEQLIRAAALMCSQIVCRTDRILTGYSFCIFTVFLAQFHPPNPEKKHLFGSSYKQLQGSSLLHGEI